MEFEARSAKSGEGEGPSAVRAVGARRYMDGTVTTKRSAAKTRRASAGDGSFSDRDNTLQVAVRVRPLDERERGSPTVLHRGGDGQIALVDPKQCGSISQANVAGACALSRMTGRTEDWVRPFDVGTVLWPDGGQEGDAVGGTTQDGVFEAVGAKVVEAAVNSFNCSVFAYGETGSGNTLSLFGMPNSSEDLAAFPAEEFGLAPRICFNLLRHLHLGDSKDLFLDPAASSIGISMQFIEIHMDRVRSLLHPTAEASAFRVREGLEGPYVENLEPVEVESWKQLQELFVAGLLKRKEKWRGHALFTVKIKAPGGRITRLNMVDLAGSERGGEGRPGMKLKDRESRMIRKDLSNLGTALRGVSAGGPSAAIPFRESAITWLLKDSFSHRAHTTVLATVSPSAANYVESMNTLKYAQRLHQASANVGRPSSAVKPLDEKEMVTLITELQAGDETSRRQVHFQMLSDPRQRLAKAKAMAEDIAAVEDRVKAEGAEVHMPSAGVRDLRFAAERDLRFAAERDAQGASARVGALEIQLARQTAVYQDEMARRAIEEEEERQRLLEEWEEAKARETEANAVQSRLRDRLERAEKQLAAEAQQRATLEKEFAARLKQAEEEKVRVEGRNAHLEALLGRVEASLSLELRGMSEPGVGDVSEEADDENRGTYPASGQDSAEGGSAFASGDGVEQRPGENAEVSRSVDAPRHTGIWRGFGTVLGALGLMSLGSMAFVAMQYPPLVT